MLLTYHSGYTYLFEHEVPLTQTIASIIIMSLHSVNALFTGANSIYEVSAKHPIIDVYVSVSLKIP